MGIFDLEKNRGKSKIEFDTPHGRITIRDIPQAWFQMKMFCNRKEVVTQKHIKKKLTKHLRPGIYCKETDLLCDYDTCPKRGKYPMKERQ